MRVVGGIMRVLRKRVLFVDDAKDVHNYASAISRKLGLKAKHAYSPEQAKTIIAFRLKAARRLLAAKKAALAETRNSLAKRKLKKQIAALQQRLNQPFDLIVSDINMPIGDPTGVPFVRKIRKKFPQQDILMHSDDLENLGLIEQQLGIGSAYKAYPTQDQSLEKGLREKLLRKKNQK